MKAIVAGILAIACLAAPAAAELPDLFHVSVLNGELLIRHYNAQYNCVQDEIAFDLTWEDATLAVTEREEPPGGYADCICYFDLAARVADLPQGPLTVKLRWLDWVHGWSEVEREVYINGDGGVGALAGVMQSECLSLPIGAGDGPWSLIKDRYR